MTVRRLCVVLFVVAAIISVVAGIFGDGSLARSRSSVSTISNHVLPSARGTASINDGLSRAVLYTRNGMIAARDGKAEGIEHAFSNRVNAIVQAERQIQTFVAASLVRDEAEFWANFSKNYRDWRNANDAIWAAIRTGDFAQATHLAEVRAEPLVEQLRQTLGHIDVSQSEHARTAVLTAAEAETWTHRALWIAIVIAVAIAFGFVLYVTFANIRISEDEKDEKPVEDVGRERAIAQANVELQKLAESLRELVSYVQTLADAKRESLLAKSVEEIRVRSDELTRLANDLQAQQLAKEETIARDSSPGGGADGSLN